MNDSKPCRPMLGLAAALCMALFPLMSGCTAVSAVKEKTREIADVVTFSDHHIKKVGIAPFDNRTFISSQDFETIFHSRFIETLADECPDVLWIKPGDAAYPPELMELPREELSGRLDNLGLAKLGKTLGLNTIVVVRAVEVDAEEKEKGILFLRDTRYFGTAQISVAAYNVGTGAKLLDESLSREAEVDGAEFDAIEAGDESGVYELSDVLEELAVNAGEKLCKAVEAQRWEGYVHAVEGDRITLSFGREAGLRAGEVLAVYDESEILENKFGQRFFIPGEKVGEIKITEIFVGKARATAISDNGIRPGSLVRPR
ncbi:hypothetical protein DENIS_3745 [Desulfonema ishimotonii]|uniref:Flagellar assembly protein T C-terminal domain-containing protein n=1 Tax=Desulfonema ishimotonii TaxID=45657 RepID=A0A401G0L5_9BACT|nr:hypothetical protein [Desulfonema ishimotonii]GBC62768.1 hypothetical protein DENIS_3745 [Desulfonema ishimotonii]